MPGDGRTGKKGIENVTDRGSLEGQRQSRRVAAVIRLRPEKEAEYRALHAAVWPQVLATLKAAKISNYSIFLRDGLLFSYLEYEGDDYEADTRLIASDEATRRWWKLTDPCQQRLETARAGEHWAPAEELFHLD
jgi:L-rhamnose mutarotase